MDLPLVEEDKKVGYPLLCPQDKGGCKNGRDVDLDDGSIEKGRLDQRQVKLNVDNVQQIELGLGNSVHLTPFDWSLPDQGIHVEFVDVTIERTAVGGSAVVDVVVIGLVVVAISTTSTYEVPVELPLFKPISNAFTLIKRQEVT